MRNAVLACAVVASALSAQQAQALGFQKVSASAAGNCMAELQMAVGPMQHSHMSLASCSCCNLTLDVSLCGPQDLKKSRRVSIPESEFKDGPEGLK